MTALFHTFGSGISHFRLYLSAEYVCLFMLHGFGHRRNTSGWEDQWGSLYRHWWPAVSSQDDACKSYSGSIAHHDIGNFRLFSPRILIMGYFCWTVLFVLIFYQEWCMKFYKPCGEHVLLILKFIKNYVEVGAPRKLILPQNQSRLSIFFPHL